MTEIEVFKYPVPVGRLYSRHTPATYLRSLRHSGTHRVVERRSPMDFRKMKKYVVGTVTALISFQLANTALISLVLWKVW